MAIKISSATVIDNYERALSKYSTTTINTTTVNTLNLQTATVWEVTLAASPVIINFSNPPSSGQFFSCMLIIKQDATGGRLLSTVDGIGFDAIWTDGQAAVLSTAANAIDVLSFFTVNGGGTWYGSFVGAAMS